MKRTIVSLTLVSLVAMASAESLKDHVNRINAIVVKSMKAKDIAMFEKAMKPSVTPDFKYIENGQTMNYKTMVENMKMGYQMMDKVTKVDIKVNSIKEMGTKGTAVYTVDMVSTMIGEDKKVHKMGFKGKATDVYVKSKGKWLCKSMTWSNVVMTMDGKPFDPSKMVAPPKSTDK